MNASGYYTASFLYLKESDDYKKRTIYRVKSN
jgi:hypothetical protein